MGLLTLLSNSLEPVSASVLQDGVTVRAVFRGPLTATSAAAGWSFVVGGSPATVSSAVIDGFSIGFTLSTPVALGATVTAAFDSTASDLSVGGSYVPSFTGLTVRNLSWSGGAAWTPASHGTNLDYGIDSDLTRLFIANSDVTPVAADGDTVGRWRGQRDAVVFNQGTSANRATYRTGGIEFDSTGGVTKQLSATRAISLTSPFTVFVCSTASAHIGGGINVFAQHNPSGITGVIGTSSVARYQGSARNAYTESTTLKSGGAKTLALSWDGASATFFNDDGSSFSPSNGANAGDFTLFALNSNFSGGGGKPLVHAWSISLGTMTSDDFKRHAWWARYKA